MTFSRRQKFDRFQREVVDLLKRNNELLEKMTALMVSDQLLGECVSPEGEVRTASECAEIVIDSFMAGVCLAEDLNSKAQEFNYQKSEFFVDVEEAEDESEEEEDEEDDDDDSQMSSGFSMAW